MAITLINKIHVCFEIFLKIEKKILKIEKKFTNRISSTGRIFIRFRGGMDISSRTAWSTDLTELSWWRIDSSASATSKSDPEKLESGVLGE